METYILQILEKNNRVIVPEFGAFIIKQRNPLTIVFNEFLQYNDGMLVDYIAKSDGITRDEAKDKIDQFVSKVTEEINKKRSYALGELGILTKSAAGKISIEKADEKATAPRKESPKTEKKAAAKEPDKAPVAKESAKAEEKKPADKPAAPKKATPPEKESEPAKAQQPSAEKKAAAPPAPDKTPPQEAATKAPEPEKEQTEKDKTETAPKAEAAKTVSDTPPKQTMATPPPAAKKEIHVRETVKTPPPRSAEPVKKAPRKKRSGVKIFLWILLIVIVNGILVSYFLFPDEFEEVAEAIADKIEAVFGSESSDADDEPVDKTGDEKDDTTRVAEEGMIAGAGLSDSREPDMKEGEDIYSEEKPARASRKKAPKASSDIEETPTRQVPAAAAQQSASTSGTSNRYWIIVNSFHNETFADSQVNELRAKGYDSQKRYDANSGFFYVCTGTYPTMAAAQADLPEVQRNYMKDAWIKKW